MNGTWISQRRPRLTVSFGIELDVVLDVRREVPVPQSQLLRVAPIGRVRKTKQEAGKRTAVVRKFGLLGSWIEVCALAEVEVTALGLLFVVVLVGAPDFDADVEGVASLRPQPVVHQRDSQLAIDRLQPGAAGAPAWSACMLAVAKRDVGRNDSIRDTPRKLLPWSVLNWLLISPIQPAPAVITRCGESVLL